MLAQQLKTLGMKMTIDTVPTNEINTLTGLGKFQSTMGYPVGYVPTAWSFYSEQMDPQFYQPVGKNIPTYEDIERFKDPTALRAVPGVPDGQPGPSRRRSTPSSRASGPTSCRSSR